MEVLDMNSLLISASLDWLRDRVYFEALVRDDNYAKSRLGFKAPNIFIMELTP
jgi:hypothetical protein